MTRLDRLLFAPGPEARLALVQRALAAVIALRLLGWPYRALARQPPALWRPRGVAYLLGGMPSSAQIVALQAAGVVVAAVVAFGPVRWRGRRGAFIAAWSALLVLAGLRTSLGKILHNDVLLLLATVPLLASPMDASIAGRRRGVRYGWPLCTASVVVAGAYFFAGWQKLVHSGPAWVLSDNMQNVFAWAAVGGRAPTTVVSSFLAGHLRLSQLIAAAAFAFELSFPLVLVRPRVRPAYAAAACLFHFGTWVTMGLDYWAWMAVDVAVLVEWRSAWHRLRREPVDGTDPVPHQLF